ncbi:MAG: PIN domain-containing protein [Bryobacterales bacterium]|nr:PIN domain-containing protein [Bryobacterales bacterium]
MIAIDTNVLVYARRLLLPGTGYSRLPAEGIQEEYTVGNLVFDAQIVALCREHGVTCLLTEDRDFDRFREFRTERLGYG